VASVPIPALKSSGLDLPAAFANIVDRALAFDRADRWPDVEALQQALRWARRTIDPSWAASVRRSEPPPEARPARGLPLEKTLDSRRRTVPRKSDGPPSAPTLIENPAAMQARWSGGGESTGVTPQVPLRAPAAPPVATGRPPGVRMAPRHAS